MRLTLVTLLVGLLLQVHAGPAAAAAPATPDPAPAAGEHDMSDMDMSDMDTSSEESAESVTPVPASMTMAGALGPQPMARESSGTSWQPDVAAMTGLHGHLGSWTTMVHGRASLVYDDQGGPRGDHKALVPSMVMLMAQRPLGPGTFGLRSMLSLDPLMGKRGYPLLFQSGETADGRSELVDRQHPHDFFMELATSYSLPIGAGSVFGYAGLPGEPALGPSAFMHRASADEIPEAPLTHHWLDSTHISFGVITLGATTRHWKLDASVFNGREPDPSRWNIETGALDSVSGRLSWNPSPVWSLQLSHAYLAEPEQLEPGVGVHRTTASVSAELRRGDARWSATVAAGINQKRGDGHSGVLAEVSRRDASRLTAFARYEWLQNDHLLTEGPLDGQAFVVNKLSIGGVYDLRRAAPMNVGAGALVSGYVVPGELRADYGSQPWSFLVFLRAALDGRTSSAMRH